jgi:hypothetical protein
MTLLTWLVGMTLLVSFLGILLWWIRAPSLTLIVVAVLVLQIWDFVQTMRSSKGGAGR